MTILLPAIIGGGIIAAIGFVAIAVERRTVQRALRRAEDPTPQRRATDTQHAL